MFDVATEEFIKNCGVCYFFTQKEALEAAVIQDKYDYFPLDAGKQITRTFVFAFDKPKCNAKKLYFVGSPSQMFNFLKGISPQNRNAYELLTLDDKPCKMYADIDCPTENEKLRKVNQWRVEKIKSILHNDFKEFWKTLVRVPQERANDALDISFSFVAKENGNTIIKYTPICDHYKLDDNSKMRTNNSLLEKCVDRMDVYCSSKENYKFSWHITFPDLVFVNNLHCGAFMRRFEKFVVSKYGSDSDTNPYYVLERECNFMVFILDRGVYTRNRVIRAVYNSKIAPSSKQRFLTPLHDIGNGDMVLDVFLRSLIQYNVYLQSDILTDDIENPFLVSSGCTIPIIFQCREIVQSEKRVTHFRAKKGFSSMAQSSFSSTSSEDSQLSSLENNSVDFEFYDGYLKGFKFITQDLSKQREACIYARHDAWLEPKSTSVNINVWYLGKEVRNSLKLKKTIHEQRRDASAHASCSTDVSVIEKPVEKNVKMALFDECKVEQKHLVKMGRKDFNRAARSILESFKVSKNQSSDDESCAHEMKECAKLVLKKKIPDVYIRNIVSRNNIFSYISKIDVRLKERKVTIYMHKDMKRCRMRTDYNEHNSNIIYFEIEFLHKYAKLTQWCFSPYCDKSKSIKRKDIQFTNKRMQRRIQSIYERITMILNSKFAMKSYITNRYLRSKPKQGFMCKTIMKMTVNTFNQFLDYVNHWVSRVLQQKEKQIDAIDSLSKQLEKVAILFEKKASDDNLHKILVVSIASVIDKCLKVDPNILIDCFSNDLFSCVRLAGRYHRSIYYCLRDDYSIKSDIVSCSSSFLNNSEYWDNKSNLTRSALENRNSLALAVESGDCHLILSLKTIANATSNKEAKTRLCHFFASFFQERAYTYMMTLLIEMNFKNPYYNLVRVLRDIIETQKITKRDDQSSTPSFLRKISLYKIDNFARTLDMLEKSAYSSQTMCDAEYGFQLELCYDMIRKFSTLVGYCTNNTLIDFILYDNLHFQSISEIESFIGLENSKILSNMNANYFLTNFKFFF